MRSNGARTEKTAGAIVPSVRGRAEVGQRLRVGLRDLIPTPRYWMDPAVKRASRFFVLPWIAVFTLFVAAPFVDWVLRRGWAAWIEYAVALGGGTLMYLGGLGLAQAVFKQIARTRMTRGLVASSGGHAEMECSHPAKVLGEPAASESGSEAKPGDPWREPSRAPVRVAENGSASRAGVPHPARSP